MIKNLIVALTVLTNMSLLGINAAQSVDLTGLPDPGCLPGQVCDDC